MVSIPAIVKNNPDQDVKNLTNRVSRAKHVVLCVYVCVCVFVFAAVKTIVHVLATLTHIIIMLLLLFCNYQ